MAKSKSVERELSPEKTQAILDGAMQEFLENGYGSARIDKIVAAAGVSKATVYRRFPDKEALFIALIQQLAVKKEIFSVHNPPCLTEEPKTFLKRHAMAMLDNITSDPQTLTFLRIIIGESGRFPELARAFVRNIEKESLDLLAHYFANHPQIQVADPEVAARMFVGTLIHFVMMRDVLHSGDLLPMEPNRLLDNLLATILGDRANSR